MREISKEERIHHLQHRRKIRNLFANPKKRKLSNRKMYFWFVFTMSVVWGVAFIAGFFIQETPMTLSGIIVTALRGILAWSILPFSLIVYGVLDPTLSLGKRVLSAASGLGVMLLFSIIILPL